MSVKNGILESSKTALGVRLMEEYCGGAEHLLKMKARLENYCKPPVKGVMLDFKYWGCPLFTSYFAQFIANDVYHMYSYGGICGPSDQVVLVKYFAKPEESVVQSKRNESRNILYICQLIVFDEVS